MVVQLLTTLIILDDDMSKLTPHYCIKMAMVLTLIHLELDSAGDKSSTWFQVLELCQSQDMQAHGSLMH